MAAIIARIQEFLRVEASAGFLLMAAALLALIINNVGFGPAYHAFLATPVAVQAGALEIAKPLVLWINDGLMALFFFLVGLEIKREILDGELSSFDKAALPLAAAIGGMAVPAAIFAWLNWGDPHTLSGWAIPAATDIAFALGVLAILGSRAPLALKTFLLAVAIIDDLGAIMIIALFYTDQLSLRALGLAAVGVAGLIALNRSGVKSITPYALLGLFIWVCVLKSGVHATLAGVATAMAIPMRGKTADAASPLQKLEHGLHPWIAFGVLPLFAFANAGLTLEGLTPAMLLAPLPLGIALGLFLGKQVGVVAFTWLAVRSGLARLPDSVGWRHVYGAACLTGIGFTMSLFIGSLAFESAEHMNAVRLGVLTGSLASALLGVAVLAGVAAPARAAERRAA